MTKEILFRGIPMFRESTEFVYGFYKHGDIAGVETDFILPLPEYKNEINEVAVHSQTIEQYTGLTDKNGKKIFEGDIVEFFGMRGKIVQDCGAFGIATTQQIDYDLLESKIPFQNNADFCFNDNFISLWELWWNYQQDDEPLEVVKVIGNATTTPSFWRRQNHE